MSRVCRPRPAPRRSIGGDNLTFIDRLFDLNIENTGKVSGIHGGTSGGERLNINQVQKACSMSLAKGEDGDEMIPRSAASRVSAIKFNSNGDSLPQFPLCYEPRATVPFGFTTVL